MVPPTPAATSQPPPPNLQASTTLNLPLISLPLLHNTFILPAPPQATDGPPKQHPYIIVLKLPRGNIFFDFRLHISHAVRPEGETNWDFLGRSREGPAAPENRSEVGPLFVESGQGTNADVFNILKGAHAQALSNCTAAIRNFLELRVRTVQFFETLIIDRN